MKRLFPSVAREPGHAARHDGATYHYVPTNYGFRSRGCSSRHIEETYARIQDNRRIGIGLKLIRFTPHRKRLQNQPYDEKHDVERVIDEVAKLWRQDFQKVCFRFGDSSGDLLLELDLFAPQQRPQLDRNAQREDEGAAISARPRASIVCMHARGLRG
jgi:hypothetical protein